MEKTAYKNLICEALAMSEYDYCALVMESGYQWMRRYFGEEMIMINALSLSSSFWKWWVNQWEQRDCEFIREASLRSLDLPLTGFHKHIACELYKDAHSVYDLKIVPNKIVTTEVSKLIKVEEQKIKELNGENRCK